MAIQQIQLPGYRPRKPSTMEQIALGVDMASKILGTGLKAYEVFGPQGQSETDKNKSESDYYKAHAATINNNNFMLATPEEIKAKKSHQIPGPDGTLINVVPRQEDQWNAAASFHKSVSDSKAADTETKMFLKAKQDLEQLRGNPGLQIAQRNLLLAQNAVSALGPYAHNPDKAPSDIQSLFSIEEAKMASGGVPQKEELQAISDPTLYKDVANLVSRIKNVPQGAGQGAFLGNHVRYVNELRDNSMKLIERTYNRKLSDWKSRLGAEDYNTLKQNMQSYLDDFKNEGLQTKSGPDGNAVIAPPPMPKPGDVIDNHRFKGGNPGDPKSWEALP